jgi:hypothetical protein
VTVAFAAGIALAGIQALPVASLLFPCLTAAALLLAARLYSPRLLPAVACTLALLLGALRQAGDEARHPNVLAPRLGERVTVTGQAWFDHQWGYTAGDLLINTGWNWFGLQLEDGRELLINEFRTNKTGETFSPMANLIEQDGRLRHTANLAIQPSNYWRSPSTGVFYPLEWDIAIPDFKITLNVTADFYQQEMPAIAPLQAIWEGACTFTGNEVLATQINSLIRGKGFMELVGYAQK